MTSHDLALALLRTTLVTSAAACAAQLLLSWLRVDSPRTHRVAWFLVVAQGWLLIPFTLELETLPPPPVAQAPQVAVRGALGGEATRGVYPTGRVALVPVGGYQGGAATRGFDLEMLYASIPAAWLLGAASLALYAAARYATIVRTLPRGEAPDDPQWQREWRRAHRTGCHAHVRALTKHMLTRTRACHANSSSHHRVPCVRPRKHAPVDFRLTQELGPLVAFIPWRYLLLAPRPLWLALTSPERTAILRHELAHIRRRDLAKSLAFRVLALPQWFNPLVWLAVRRFDEAAEWQCDSEAVGDPRTAACGLARNTTIASALIHTAELASLSHPPRTLGFLAAVPSLKRKSSLTRRIQRLITPRLKEESRMKRFALPALLLAIAAAQLIRIEYVAAETPPPAVYQGDGTRMRSSDHWIANPPASPAVVADDGPRRRITDELPQTVAEWMAGGPEREAPPRRPFFENALAMVRTADERGHRIQAGDVLQIKVDFHGARSDYRLTSHDMVEVSLENVLSSNAEEPYSFGGNVERLQLGKPHGQIDVSRLTLREATEEIERRLRASAPSAVATVKLLTPTAEYGSEFFTVETDGKIAFRSWGVTEVAGLTIDGAQGRIADELAKRVIRPRVTIKLQFSKAWSACVVVSRAPGDESFTRIAVPTQLEGEVERGATVDVMTALKQAAASRPVDFARATMYFVHADARGVALALPLEWDAAAGRLTEATNYTLQPGDLICVDAPTTSSQVVPAAASAIAPPAAAAGYYGSYSYQAPPVAAASANTSAAPFAAAPPPSAETQATLDEAKAARQSGDRNREFAALAKLPYIIEPPDILGVVIAQPQKLTVITMPEHKRYQCLVAMDGTINVEPVLFGVSVAGLTIDEAEAAIRKQLPKSFEKSSVKVRVTGFNSKVAYVITKNPGSGDEVVRVPLEYPLSADNNIGKLLKSVYGFKSIPTGAKVTLCPAGVKEADAREIIWDAYTSTPTPETNYPLLPGDRIFVEAAGDPSRTIAPHDELAVTFKRADGAPMELVDAEALRREPRITIAPDSNWLTFHIPVEEDGRITFHPWFTTQTIKVAGLSFAAAAQAIHDGTFGPQDRDYTVAVNAAEAFPPAPAAAAPSPATSGPYAPTPAAAPAIVVEYPLDPATLAALPQPAPAQPSPYRPTAPQVAVPPEARVQVEMSWDGFSRPRHSSFLATEGLTVSKVMTLLVRPENRLHRSMLDQVIGVPEVFSGANIRVFRPAWHEGDNDKSCEVRWDDASGRIAGDDVELKAGDKLYVKLLDVKISAKPIPDGDPTVSIQVVGSQGTGQMVRFEHGLTIAEAIAAMSPPPAIDFAKASIVLCRPERTTGNYSRGQVLTVSWDGPGSPNKDSKLQSGDYIRIEPTGRPLAQSPGAAPQPPATPPVPASQGAPAIFTAPQPLGVIADGIAYKLSFLEDTSGDLAEFVGGYQAAVRETAALQPALKVLGKHGLVKISNEPRIVTQEGQPAEFNIGEAVPGKDRVFRNLQHVKIVGRAAADETTADPQNEPAALDIEIDAVLRHAEQRHTLDAEFRVAPGESVIARMKTPNGSPSPLYLVVTPEWLD